MVTQDVGVVVATDAVERAVNLNSGYASSHGFVGPNTQHPTLNIQLPSAEGHDRAIARVVAVPRVAPARHRAEGLLGRPALAPGRGRATKTRDGLVPSNREQRPTTIIVIRSRRPLSSTEREESVDENGDPPSRFALRRAG